MFREIIPIKLYVPSSCKPKHKSCLFPLYFSGLWFLVVPSINHAVVKMIQTLFLLVSAFFPSKSLWSPCIIRRQCTHWVKGRYWPQTEMAIVDCLMHALVQILSNYYSFGPTLHLVIFWRGSPLLWAQWCINFW